MRYCYRDVKRKLTKYAKQSKLLIKIPEIKVYLFFNKMIMIIIVPKAQLKYIELSQFLGINVIKQD